MGGVARQPGQHHRRPVHRREDREVDRAEDPRPLGCRRQRDPDSPVAPDDTDTVAATPTEGESAISEPTDAAAEDTQDSADTEASDPAQAEPVAAEAAKSSDGGAATDGDSATDGGGDERPRG
ncbi:hypothetical protein [Amycolatopsis pithecellobii]|uniref:hypothetical protein n=1 Tax=Amycolatopsis pithecellobii TaxID=664692 RepID=UPI001AA07245|nr:hypothetical protein [Amycolatopsis pithecellobii]